MQALNNENAVFLTTRVMSLVFSQLGAELYIPDGAPEAEAMSRVSHLIVCSHQDDVEFMGFPLIKDAYGRDVPRLAAVVMTNGAGSPRSGIYATCTDEAMQDIRHREQRRAADIGHYAALIQLHFPSASLRDPQNHAPADELAHVLRAMRPQVVMTHNFADKHDSHVATALTVVRAIRLLPREERPLQLLGGEIWRGLDWVSDREKLRLNAGDRDDLATTLLNVYHSQIAGGKRYDLATLGRQRANATYGDPYAVDDAEAVSYAIDMTPLIQDDTLSPESFMLGFVDRLANEIRETLHRVGG